MRSVRSHGNRSTELALRTIFRSHHVTGWRRHIPLTGKPDFAFATARLVVFVDGCFWHGCPQCYRNPKANKKFWVEKHRYNRARDVTVSRVLRGSGWRVLRLWENELRDADAVAQKVKQKLNQRA
jgi:DNA mismatch endonuclease (patch repair protein)